MQVRIESDGTPSGTMVIDVATGEKLNRVIEAKWRCVAREMPTVELEIGFVPGRMTGIAEVYMQNLVDAIVEFVNTGSIARAERSVLRYAIADAIEEKFSGQPIRLKERNEQ